MTLILNEIHLIDGFKETRIVAAADRRLTRPYAQKRKEKHPQGKKLFEIPHLKGTVSYFGYSYVLKNGGWELLSSWLPNFIKDQYTCRSLGAFSQNLRDTLNQIMPGKELKSFPTGFHICGYDDRGIPEFWHFSNCNVGADFNYVNVRSRFRKPNPDFLGRDAPQLGWDGKNPSSVTAKNVVQYYRNGDFKVHEAAWKKIDEVFEILYGFKGFTRPRTNEEIEKYVRFKLKFIGAVYQNWAHNKIVGGPFDVLVKNN